MSQVLPTLQSYGIEKLSAHPEIITFRYICNFENVTEENCLDCIKHIDLINFDDYDIISSKKHESVGYFMKWHLDDAQLLKHNKKFKDKFNKQTEIKSKHVIYYPFKKPVYSAIVYFSNHGEDFTGGEFMFADGVKVKPKRFLSEPK